MKKIFFALGWWCCAGVRLFAQTNSLYDDTRVSAIYLELPADSLAHMLAQLENDRYTAARFVFDNGSKRDTVENVGLRLRGNTSLGAKKKSFKISFNAFETDQKYQGIKKLNLRGQHNDPTMVREKLFYEVWEKAGMPPRRAAFVRLYINQQYRGLYTNLEELDKTWLDQHFDDDDGNLYKCNYPADLVYLGPDQQAYKNILNNPEERAYDLKTNEQADDYTRLVALAAALDQTVDGNFASQIRQILDVESVLKSFAIDVATGNWDDYFYNKNNYYLYDDPASEQFKFITFDTDNTFGVDWLNKDWAKRNCLAWLPSGQARPLASKLLAVPAFKNLYVRYLDTLTRNITHPDTIFPRIDALRALVAPAVLNDPFHGLDYGYTFEDFEDGFEKTVDSHTPYGIKPFLAVRYEHIRDQIEASLETLGPQQPGVLFEIHPNPAADRIWIKSDSQEMLGEIRATIFSAAGQWAGSWKLQQSASPQALDIGYLPVGAYVLQLQTCVGAFHLVFVK